MNRGIALLLVAALHAACTPPRSGSPFAVLETSPPPASIDGRLLLCPADSPQRWRLCEGDSSREILVLLTGTGDIRYDDGLGQRQELEEAGEGGFALRLVSTPDEDAVTHFDPPLLAFPREVGREPAPPVDSLLSVNWQDPARGERDAGRGVLQQRLLARVRLELPCGLHDAIVVESRFDADLRLATVRTVTRTYVVEGLGPVAIEEERVARFAGVPVHRRQLSAALIGPASP